MKEGRAGSVVKWIVWLALAAGVAYGGWWYWNKPKNTGPLYRTAIVTRGDITQAVTATGQLNPVANVQVGSQISGMIKQLYVDYNASVTQGQVVAELDPATYLAAMHQAEGDLTNSLAVLELAQVEAKRAETLRAEKLIAESDYDKSIAELHQAQAQTQMRAAQVERARVDLSRCTIYAPTNGTVISRNVDSGQTVAASLQAPTLFVIANDLRKMQIDAMVSEADIGGVEERQPVTFSVDAFPTRTFHGEVIQIRNAPTTNQNVVTYDTVVAVNNNDMKLKPGMTANVSIILADHPDVLKIPNSALRFRPADAAPASPGRGSRGGGGGGEGGGTGPGGSGGGGERRGGRGNGPRGEGMGSRGGSPDGAGQRQHREDRAMVRTIYTLSSTNSVPGQPEPKPEPRQVKLGISDGVYSEVLEGVKEGDIIVVGSNAIETPQRQSGPANPLGGGRRF